MFRRLVVLSIFGLFAAATVYGLNSEASHHLSASFHGVVVADQKINAKDYDEGIAELDKLLSERLDRTVNVDLDGKSIQFSPEELGVEFDTYKTAEKIYRANDKLGFLKRVYRVKVDPVASVNTEKLYESLSEHVAGIYGPKDSTVTFTESGYYVTDHVDGVKIAEEKFANNLVASLVEGSMDLIKIDSEVIPADYSADQAEVDAASMSAIYGKTLQLVYSDDVSTKFAVIEYSPEWIKVKNNEYVFDKSYLETFVKENISAIYDIERQDAVINALPTVENTKADVEGFARDGRKVDVDKTVVDVAKAVKSGKTMVFVTTMEDPALVVNNTNVDLGEMKLIATGRSNFKGSSPGRVANITFGLEEKFNNVILSPGGVFSAIQNSGKEISTYTGWSMAKVILGGEVVNGVGGGLCQASTTVYRAALNAGMDILFRQQHSVYVSYYSAYGDGLDAAIFNAEGLDFKFKNTTPGYILMQSVVDGDDAYVNFYGTDDGRTVEMIGPFYGQHDPNPHELLQGLRWNQIGWIRRITSVDGDVTEEAVVSSYKGMPRIQAL